MELLEEIGAPDAAADKRERADAQQTFHALSFPARHGARVIQRLTAACGSLVDMGFPHLKRMKKHDDTPGMLLALTVPVALNATTLSEELHEELQREYDGSLCWVDVLKRPPQTREAWELHTKHWPLIFHASVAPEAQVEPITAHEARAMATLVRQAVASGRRFQSERQDHASAWCCASGCVIADPNGAADGTAYAIVSDAFTRLEDVGDGSYAFYTLFHPVMIAIDGVAARDRARGGDAGPARKQRRVEASDSTATVSDITTMTESYLCTGYDVFVDVEPCTMCAMALVHSRARRIVFAKRNSTDGALASVHRLHTIKSLNHRYRVFQLPVTNETGSTP